MGRIKDWLERRSATGISERDKEILESWGLNPADYRSTDALKEATYFTCIDILSKSVGKIPCHLMQHTNKGARKAREHYLYDIVNLRPNPYMTAIDYQRAIEATRQDIGHSFGFIDRDYKGYVKGLYPFQPKRIVIDDAGLIKSTKSNKILAYYLDEKGAEHSVLYDNILHFKGFTKDGIHSQSVRNQLGQIIETNTESQKYLLNLFRNNLTSTKLALQLVSDITDEKELKKIQKMFESLINNADKTSRILPVPAGYGLKPLNISLADAQYEQIKRLSIQQIAAAFGIKMHQLNDLTDANNNSLEQQNLSFYVETLLPLLTSIEQEMTYKLLTEDERRDGYYFRFNENVILRTDGKTQAEILTKYVAGSIKTPNEARRMLGDMDDENGNDLIVNAGVYRLKDLGKLPVKPTENKQNGGDDSGK